MEYKYRWFHFASQKSGVGRTTAKTYEEYCRKILNWNKNSLGVWQYSEE